jgi:predicted PurR-regulated permease PerM
MRTTSIVVLATLAVVFALHAAAELFIPLVLSIMLSFALSPVVTLLQRAHIPRSVGAVIVLAALGGILGALSYSLSDNVQAWLEELPAAAQNARRVLTGGQPESLQQVQKAASTLERSTAEAMQRNPAPPGVTRVEIVQPHVNLGDYLWWGTKNAMALVLQIAMVVFLVYVLLWSGDLYKRKLVKIAGPSLSNKRVTVEILNEIQTQIERFLFVQFVTAVIVGVGTWLAYHFIGLENAAVWGVAVGIISAIPYFGPLAVILAATVVGFLQFESLGMAALVGGVTFIISGLASHALIGWLTSRASHMNAVAVFVGLLFGGWLWGVWGILLAVPLMVTVKVVAEHVERFRAVAELLGE